jgi:hypothetical protein
MPNWDLIDQADAEGDGAYAELAAQLAQPGDQAVAPSAGWLTTDNAEQVAVTLQLHQAAIALTGLGALRVPLGPTSSRLLEHLQREGFETLARLLPALFLSRDITPESVVDVSFGQTRASRALRQQVRGRASVVHLGRELSDHDLPPELPVPPLHGEDWDFVWRAGVDPQSLFDRATRDLIAALGPLVAGGTTGWSDYKAWLLQCTTDVDGITAIEPRQSAWGDRVSLFGQFPPDQPVGTHVVLPDNATESVIAKDVVWTDSAIEFTVPVGADSGCVGFLRAPDPIPSWSSTGSAEALLSLASALGETALYGTAAWGAAEAAVQLAATVPLTLHPAPPPCLRRNRDDVIPNFLYVGPPIIKRFETGSGKDATVVEKEALDLFWAVENATSITIVPISNPATSPDALPEVRVRSRALAAAGTWRSAPLTRTSPFRDWSGTYELTASNPSGSVSATVHIDVVERAALFGLADTHVHLMGHLASGGFAVKGTPHPVLFTTQGEDAQKECLAPCTHPGHGTIFPTWFNDPPSLDERHCLNGGFPDFTGWPHQSSPSHQAAYIEWLRRAYDGGLRLVVCLAGNSAHLANRILGLGHHGLAPDDTSAIERQVSAMKRMVAFVEQQTPLVGQSKGWMEIAKDADSARRIVQEGRLCIVLGVEVAQLGNWATPEALKRAAGGYSGGIELPDEVIDPLAAQLIDDLVDKLNTQGVTHVFPLHALNNAFGGAGLFVKDYDAANYNSTGKSFEVAPAPAGSGISYRLDNATYRVGKDKLPQHLSYYGLSKAGVAFLAAGSSTVVAVSLKTAGASLGASLAVAAIGALVGLFAGWVDSQLEPIPPEKPNWSDPVIEGKPNNSGHINAQGASRYLPMLLKSLMKRGMIIDIDHMGVRTLEVALTYAEGWNYPVISGHTQFREQKHGFAAPAGKVWKDPPVPLGAALQALAQTDVDREFGTRDPDRLSTEIDKSVLDLRRIKDLGGYISPIIGQGHLRDCGCSGVTVANTSPGSSRSFARALQYAVHNFGPRHIGFGSDINGAGPLPSPRFGPMGATSLAKREQSFSDAVNSLAAGGTVRVRRQAILAQDRGVAYSQRITDIEPVHRWEAPHEESDAPFGAEERMIFYAILVSRSDSLARTFKPSAQVAAIAQGLRAATRGDLPVPTEVDHIVGYRLAHPLEPALPGDAAAEILVMKGRVIKEHLDKMDALAATQQLPHVDLVDSPIYQGTLLTRTSAADRRYDINVDGLAHIGLLPDFMQDLHNLGVQEIASLYRSANDYIVMWERCEERSKSVQ